MKRVAFFSATVAMLILSGCSSKEPSIDATANANTSVSDSSAAAASSTGNTSSTSSAAISGSDSASTTANSGAVIAPVSGTAVDSATANGSDSAAANGSDGDMVTILFDFDKFDIREDMQEPMAKNALLVKGKAIKLEGNCDEFGSDEYNYALGLKRANAVKSSLVESGINPDSIAMTSLGESNPVCVEKTQECWAKNRRVDFKRP
jgi:peptidoglycan-associated lipoprotein